MTANSKNLTDPNTILAPRFPRQCAQTRPGSILIGTSPAENVAAEATSGSTAR